jgi:hypothetical protein
MAARSPLRRQSSSTAMPSVPASDPWRRSALHTQTCLVQQERRGAWAHIAVARTLASVVQHFLGTDVLRENHHAANVFAATLPFSGTLILCVFLLSTQHVFPPQPLATLCPQRPSRPSAPLPAPHHPSAPRFRPCVCRSWATTLPRGPARRPRRAPPPSPSFSPSPRRTFSRGVVPHTGLGPWRPAPRPPRSLLPAPPWPQPSSTWTWMRYLGC